MIARQVKAQHVCVGDIYVTGDLRREVESTVAAGIAVTLRCSDGSTPILAKDSIATVERPAADECRYRLVDSFPYLDREDEYDDLSLDEAAARWEDIVPGYGADDLIADIDDGVDWPVRYTDDETGREVTLTRTVS